MPKPKQKIKFLTSAIGEGVLSTKYADIFTIEFLPDNIKGHDMDGIKQSIRTFGFVEPIGINRVTGNDIFGNGRLEALQQMFRDGEPNPRGIIAKRGTWYAPIVDGLEFDAQSEITLAIGMNRIAEKGGIDPTKAVAILRRIAEQYPDRLPETGYDQEAIDRIRAIAKFNEQVKQVSADIKENPEDTFHPGDLGKKLNEKWEVKYDDTFQIGRHRLICVDSAAGDLDYRLPTGCRLVFTSPPYAHQRTYELEGEKFDWTELMTGVTDNIFRVLQDPGDVIINLGQVYENNRIVWYWNDWLKYCDEIEHPCYGLYVWDKLAGFPGEYHGRLARCHEWLFHFKVGKGSANKWIPTNGSSIERGPLSWGSRQEDGKVKQRPDSPEKWGQPVKVPDSVVRLYGEMARGIHTEGHPAVFPVALPEFFINTFTAAKDAVFDPFAGSGSTMIAAENLDRICYASEISPNYCALILERMQTTFPELEIKKL